MTIRYHVNIHISLISLSNIQIYNFLKYGFFFPWKKGPGFKGCVSGCSRGKWSSRSLYCFQFSGEAGCLPGSPTGRTHAVRRVLSLSSLLHVLCLRRTRIWDVGVGFQTWSIPGWGNTSNVALWCWSRCQCAGVVPVLPRASLQMVKDRSDDLSCTVSVLVWFPLPWCCVQAPQALGRSDLCDTNCT